MKKLMAAIAAVLCLASCGPQVNRNTTASSNQERHTPIERFLMDYHRSHPDWLINDAVASRTNDSLMTAFESVADTIFNGYPMKVVIVNEYEKGGYCVNLRAWQKPSRFKLADEIHEIGGDIIGLISEDMAMKIKEDEFYTFKGKFVKRTNHDFYKKMARMSKHYTDGYGVRKNDTWKDKYDFGFGILVYAIDTLVAY